MTIMPVDVSQMRGGVGWGGVGWGGVGRQQVPEGARVTCSYPVYHARCVTDYSHGLQPALNAIIPCKSNEPMRVYFWAFCYCHYYSHRCYYINVTFQMF